MRPKPIYGAPCNNCGLCCVVSQCPISLLVFGPREGRCPALEPDGLGGFRCGFVDHAEGDYRKPAELMIGAGHGCDMAGTPQDYAEREKRRPHIIRQARREEEALTPDQRRIFLAWKTAAVAKIRPIQPGPTSPLPSGHGAPGKPPGEAEH